MRTRVIVVRHGLSTYNQMRRIQGHCDESSLAAAGEAQARQVGQALEGTQFDYVCSSPLKRAKQTAELIVNELQRTVPNTPAPVFTDKLKEISLPLWEGLSFEEAEARYPEEYRAWREDPVGFSMEVSPGQVVHPVQDVYRQAQDFWQELLAAQGGKTILVVGHSAINRALVSTAIGLGPDQYNHLHQANCGISVLNFDGQGGPAQLEAMNLTPHLGEPLPALRSRHRGPRMVLVRHGETDWNRERRFQGQIDVPLNDNGRQQAQKAAEFLKSVPFTAAYSSSLLRPKETAEIILQHHPGLELGLVDALQEISHGQWEGKFADEVEAGYPGMLQQWQDAPETVQMPEGENLQQVWDRSIVAWKQLVAAHSGGDTPAVVLVSAHDAINKAILSHVVNQGPGAFWRFKQGNGAVSVIDYPDGVDSEPVLSAANIAVHLSGGVFDRTAAGAL